MARNIDFPPEKRHISQSGLFLLGEMNSALKTELLESTMRGIYMQSTWYQHFLDKHRFCICLMQGILTISEGRPSSCGWSISWTLVCGGLVFLLQCLYAACSIFCGALSTALPLSVPVTQAPHPWAGRVGDCSGAELCPAEALHGRGEVGRGPKGIATLPNSPLASHGPAQCPPSVALQGEETSCEKTARMRSRLGRLLRQQRCGCAGCGSGCQCKCEGGAEAASEKAAPEYRRRISAQILKVD